MVMNALTIGFFDANLMDFFTGRQNGVYNAGGDGGQRLTLPEIIGLSGSGGVGGTYSASGKGVQSMMEAIKYNLSGKSPTNAGWIGMSAQVVGIPVAFKLAKRFARKPLNSANKLLRASGIKEVKV